MKIECDVVRDLIPLYMEGLASEGSSEYLLEHIKHCSECRKVFEELQKELIENKENPIIDIPNLPPNKLVKRIKNKISTIFIMFFVIIILAVGITSKVMQKRYYPEVTYSILTYEEAPDIIKSRIQESNMPNSTNNISGGSSGESYVVIIPPENKFVEVISVEKDKNAVHGMKYRYRYVDTTKDNSIDNLRIIKINNFRGSIAGVRDN